MNKQQKALDAQLDLIIDKIAPAEGQKLMAPNPCDQYHQLAPIIKTIIPLLSFVPVYGARIAEIVRLLDQIAGNLCPKKP